MKIKQQKGAVLVVALILLLVLTLVGVAGMQDTTLQEKMAGNMQDRNLAFQAAEAALRAGEVELQAAVLPAFNNTGGLITETYSFPSGGTTYTLQAGSAAYWEKFPWANNSRSYGVDLSNVGARPRYVLEKIPVVTAPQGESQVFDSGGIAELESYRVTAMGTGGSADAVVILQSTYRR